MAANCLLEVRNRTAIEAISTKLLNAMKSVVETEYKQEKGEDFLYAIASVWKENPTTFDWLEKKVKQNSNYRIRADAVQAITKVFENSLILQLLTYSAQFDRTITVRKLAVENIIEYWDDYDEILSFLYKVTRTDQKFSVINSIISKYNVDKNNRKIAFNILKHCLKYNNYSDSALGAFNELVKNWMDYPENIKAMEELKKSNNTFDFSWDEQKLAIKKIARFWQVDIESYNIIKQVAASDRNNYVRKTAIEELAKGWKEHPETYSIIKQAAISDSDDYVRETAIEKLVKYWKEHPETYSIIKQAAIADSNYHARIMAIAELVKDWKQQPETYRIIKQIAVSDSYYNIRKTAILELAKGWKDNSEVFEILCDRAINDPYQRQYTSQTIPRQLSLQIITEQYKDRPEVLPLLRDRAANDPDERIREFAQKQLEKLTNESTS